MDVFGITAFRIITVFIAFVVIWLMTGCKRLGEATPVDVLGLVMFGTVAGMTVINSNWTFFDMLITLIGISLVQLGAAKLAGWLQTRQKRVPERPLVIVEQGQIVKPNLVKAQLSVKKLLALLRNKGIFHIKEVRFAIWELHGELSVLREEKYSPLRPEHLHLETVPVEVAVPIILEGNIQEDALENLGFSQEEIEVFKRRHKEELRNMLVAYMNQSRQVQVVKDKMHEDTIF